MREFDRAVFAMDKGQVQECARQILEVLSPGDRPVKVLGAEYEDFDFAEISEVLGEGAKRKRGLFFEEFGGLLRRGFEESAGELLAKLYSQPGNLELLKGLRARRGEGASRAQGAFGEIDEERRGVLRRVEHRKGMDALGVGFFEGARALRGGREGYEDFGKPDGGDDFGAGAVYENLTGERAAQMERVSDFFRRDARRYDAPFEKF